MNRCRRLIYEISTTLARQGSASLVFDLYGTGESAGTFQEATWQKWIQDIGCVYKHCKRQGYEKIIIVGLRLGALLAIHTIDQLDLNPDHIILIAPQLSGEKIIRQQLRARMTADQFTAAQYGGEPTRLSDLYEKIERDGFLDVSGYTLSKTMAEGIRFAQVPRLEDIKVDVIEAVPLLQDNSSSVKKRSCNTWQTHRIEAPPLWSQVEPEDPKAFANKVVELMFSADTRP